MNAQNGGVPCPLCGTQDAKVIDSRCLASMPEVRRRRACVCGFRYTTYERVQSSQTEILAEMKKIRALVNAANGSLAILDEMLDSAPSVPAPSAD